MGFTATSIISQLAVITKFFHRIGHYLPNSLFFSAGVVIVFLLGGQEKSRLYKGGISEYAQEFIVAKDPQLFNSFDDFLKLAHENQKAIWETGYVLPGLGCGRNIDGADCSFINFYSGRACPLLSMVYVNVPKPRVNKSANALLKNKTFVQWGKQVFFVPNRTELKNAIWNQSELNFMIGIAILSLLSFKNAMANLFRNSLFCCFYLSFLIATLLFNSLLIMGRHGYRQNGYVLSRSPWKLMTSENKALLKTLLRGNDYAINAAAQIASKKMFVVRSYYSPARYCRFRLNDFCYLYYVDKTEKTFSSHDMVQEINPNATWHHMKDGYWMCVYWDLWMLNIFRGVLICGCLVWNLVLLVLLTRALLKTTLNKNIEPT